MWISFSYQILFVLLAIAWIPKLVYNLIVHEKYRKSLPAKLGFFPLSTIKRDGKVFWIHAVSMGETKAISPLAKKIHQAYPNATIIVTSGTETGHAEAKKSIPFADHHLFFPLDFPWVVKRVLKKMKPDMVIFSETDYWYNFTRYAKAQRAKLIVVNGKISARSLKRYQKIKWFSHRLFQPFDLICTQNNIYSFRFESLGVLPSHIMSTGNLKFDEAIPKLSTDELNRWKALFGITKNDLVLAIGSTHAPEEEQLLSVLDTVWRAFPQLKVLMAPRHPERFAEVATLLTKKNIPFKRFSTKEPSSSNEKIILIDTMGQLRMCYQLADIAIVAGSYVSHVGGHNILEPSGYGVPVLFGPHMQSQPDFFELSYTAGAGLQIEMGDLAKTLIDLLEYPEKRQEIGKAGLQLIADHQGATQRTFEAIQGLV